MSAQSVKYYSASEERLNIASHAFGLLLSVVGLVLLWVRASASNQSGALVSSLVFGFSLIVLYAASTMYHTTTEPEHRQRWRVIDHAAIYVLIAGTYTPFMILSLPGALGYGILIGAWVLAVIGVVLKLFFTGRYTFLSTAMYVLMGWAIVFVIKPLAANLSPAGLQWLIYGGVAYTLGALLYAVKKLPFNHAIFHGFVLIGSVCHFIAVYSHMLND